MALLYARPKINKPRAYTSNRLEYYRYKFSIFQIVERKVKMGPKNRHDLYSQIHGGGDEQGEC